MRITTAIGIACLATLSPQLARAEPGVIDSAKLFSPKAIAAAESDIAGTYRASGWQIMIKTVDSVPGADKQAAIRAAAESEGRKSNVHGMFLLISKDDHKLYGVASNSAKSIFPQAKIDETVKAVIAKFKANDFDGGLAAAVADAEKFAMAAPSPSLAIGVRDGAKLFGADAVSKANRALKLVAFARTQVAIESVDSLKGVAVEKAAHDRAAESKVHGLYVLLSKGDRKTFMIASKGAESLFPKEKIAHLVKVVDDQFKGGKFDDGLLDLVYNLGDPMLMSEAGIRAPVATAPAGVAPQALAKAEAPPSSYLQHDTAKAKHSDITPPAPEATPAPSPSSAHTPAPASAPPRAIPPVEEKSSLPKYLALGAAGIVVLWLASMMFRKSSAPSQPGYAPQPQAYAPPPPQQPGYAPGPRPAAPGYGPPPPQPGYGPPPGYGQPGYGPPPAQGGGGGGFVSGALGGLGGAIAGNYIYDKMTHRGEHPQDVSYGHESRGAAPTDNTPYQAPAPGETYNANEGAGGDWGTPTPAPAPDADWSGSDNSGAGGDWGSAPAPAEDTGAGGDWGTPAQDSSGAGGDWGGTPDTSGDQGGGDWGSPDPAPEPDQEGGW